MKKSLKPIAFLTLLVLFSLSCQKEKTKQNVQDVSVSTNNLFDVFLSEMKTECGKKMFQLENTGSNQPLQKRLVEPENPDNPYDALGQFHNDMLDYIGSKISQITNTDTVFSVITLNENGVTTPFLCNTPRKKVFGVLLTNFYANNPSGPRLPSAIFTLMQTESDRITSQNIYQSLDFYETQGIINSCMQNLLGGLASAMVLF